MISQNQLKVLVLVVNSIVMAIGVISGFVDFSVISIILISLIMMGVNFVVITILFGGPGFIRGVMDRVKSIGESIKL